MVVTIVTSKPGQLNKLPGSKMPLYYSSLQARIMSISKIAAIKICNLSKRQVWLIILLMQLNLRFQNIDAAFTTIDLQRSPVSISKRMNKICLGIELFLTSKGLEKK